MYMILALISHDLFSPQDLHLLATSRLMYSIYQKITGQELFIVVHSRRIAMLLTFWQVFRLEMLIHNNPKIDSIFKVDL